MKPSPFRGFFKFFHSYRKDCFGDAETNTAGRVRYPGMTNLLPRRILTMVNVSIRYTGNLHCDATHGPSQSKIATDAPADNRGKGEAFSPTDLVATALGTCISTTMGITHQLGVDLRGMTVSVQKEMSKDAPRRIVSLPSEVHLPLPPDSPHRIDPGTNRTQLSSPQKPSAGNQPADQIFLGRIAGGR